jgi:hypothetical protein
MSTFLTYLIFWIFLITFPAVLLFIPVTFLIFMTDNSEVQ